MNFLSKKKSLAFFSLIYSPLRWVGVLLFISRSRVFPDKESMMAGAMELAGEIAARSPVAVQGTKINLLYSRDHSVSDSLNYMVK